MQPTSQVIVNGAMQPAAAGGFPVQHQSIVDAFGIYETVLAERGRLFHLDWHLQRLGQSAEILALDLPASLAEIGEWCRRLLATTAEGDALVRIVAFGSDGVNPPVASVYAKPRPRHPTAFTEEGIYVATGAGERLHPLAKSTNCLAQALVRRQAWKLGAHEGLLVDRFGHVTEGTTCNVMVVRGGDLLRPPAGTTLAGVTEGVVVQLAGALGIPVREAALPLAEASTWDEVFITSTNRRIFPVRRFDDLTLASSPGPVTRRLMAAFRDYEATLGWE